MESKTHDALPCYNGPKLQPFQFQSRNSTFTLLGHLGTGLHNEVFKCSIEGRVFAIKIFRFYSWNQLTHKSTLARHGITVQDIICQLDPFHCECRAYGRLQETDSEFLAIKCHGYILLSATQEAELTERGFSDWNRLATEENPLRAIVKEYIPQQPYFTFKMIPRMRQNLISLNRLGILVYDIRKENYLGGQIVDFSQANVVPHMHLEWKTPVFGPTAIKQRAVYDLEGFDAMMEEWNINNPTQRNWRFFLSNPLFTRRLRRQTRFGGLTCDQEGARFDILFYDWRNKRPGKRRKLTAAQINRLKEPKEPIG